MSEKVKFSDEELKDLEQLQNDYSQKQVELGQVHVQRLLLNQQIEELHNKQSALEQGCVPEAPRTKIPKVSGNYPVAGSKRTRYRSQQ